MEQALRQIYRQHSQGFRHDYARHMQILDVDLTGMPCGKKAALATKGYFTGARNRHGRQLGRVLATRYGEVVTDQLFEGRTKLSEAFVPLVQAAEDILELNDARRAHTLLRVDAGGGSLADVNWALERGYLILCKDYSGRRATRLAASVTRWVEDPEEPGRQIGWVEVEASEYVRPVRRLAVRKRKPNGQWGIAVLISNLLPSEVEELSERSFEGSRDLVKDLLLAHVSLYDQRGGGVEISFKGDKQGVALGKRSKKRFEAQQMVMLLESLAHNLLVWAKEWLAVTASLLRQYGPLRLVRDLFHISGFLLLDARGRLRQIGLNQDDPFASVLLNPLQQFLAPAHVAIYLAKT